MAPNVTPAYDALQGPNPHRRDRTVVHDHHLHLAFVTTYRHGVFDTEMLNRREHARAQVCVDFGATLAELNGEQDQVHLLVQYPPKVAISHLVNSLNDVSSRQLRQDFAGRINAGAIHGQILAPVILRRIMPWRTTLHSPGLHHQTETTRLGKVSSLPARAGFPPQSPMIGVGSLARS